MENFTAITYYKLEECYPNDFTKRCGLSGSEIDNNFHFLRGNDIESAYTSGGTIYLQKVNSGETIGIDLTDYLESAISIESEIRESADTILWAAISAETERAESAETELREYFDEYIQSSSTSYIELNNKIEDEIERAISAETVLSGSIENNRTYIECVENRISGLSAETSANTQAIYKLYGATSANTQAISTLNGRIECAENTISGLSITTSANTQAIDELKGEIRSTSINEDIKISEQNPLYPFVKDLWSGDTIPSGTTLTEFVKTLLTMKDEKKIHYISTSDNISKFIIDNCKLDVSGFTSIAATVSSFTMNINEGDKTYIIALPWDKNIVSLSVRNAYFQDIDEENFTMKKLLIKGSSEFKAYNVYYHSDTLGTSNGQEFNIIIG